MKILRRVATTAVATLFLAGAAPFEVAGAAAKLTTIYTFPAGTKPMTGLVTGPNGALYGATNNTIYELTQSSGSGWVVTTIYRKGATQLAGSASALYAVLNDEVYELTPPTNDTSSWMATTLHTFNGHKDGSAPKGVAVASDGSIVGTTQTGGGSPACGSGSGVATGCGTLFRLTKSKDTWSETILHAFKSSDGASPLAAPSFDSAGNVYLTTYLGGAKGSESNAASLAPASVDISPNGAGQGCGTEDDEITSTAAFVGLWYAVCASKAGYPLYPASVVTPLNSKPLNSEGSKFTGSLPFEGSPANGAIFTSTGGGNPSQCVQASNGGCGVVALLAEPASGKTPWDLTVLHVFSGSDGADPLGYLTADGADALYGVTFAGGTSNAACPNGCGTIFALANGKDGWAWGGVVYKFTTLAYPVPQLTLFSRKLLGTTESGGPHYRGTIYELSAADQDNEILPRLRFGFRRH